MNGIEIEVLHKMRSAVKAKLNELKTGYIGPELPEYVMILLVNHKTGAQMETALRRFLGRNTQTFVAWLLDVITKLQDVTVPSEKTRNEKGESTLSTITDLIREGLIQKVKIDLQLAATVKTEVISLDETVEEDPEDRDRVKKQLEELQKKIDKAKKKLLDDADNVNGEKVQTEKVEKAKTDKAKTDKTKKPEVSKPEKTSKLEASKNEKVKKPEASKPEKTKKPEVSKSKSPKKRPSHPKSKERDKTPPRRHSSPQRRTRHRSRSPKRSNHKRKSPLSLRRKIIERHEKERSKSKKEPVKSRIVKPPESRHEREPRLNGGHHPRFRRMRSPDRFPERRKVDGRRKLESVVSSSTAPPGPSLTPPLALIPRTPEHPPKVVRDNLVIEVSNDVIDIGCDEVISLDDDDDKLRDVPKVVAPKPVETQFIVTISGRSTTIKRKSPSKEEVPEAVAAPKRARISPIRFDLNTTTPAVEKEKKKSTIRLTDTSHKFDNVPSLNVPGPTAPGGPKVKLKERCKFFPHCRDGATCEFYHPSTPCITFPVCSFGDKCLYLHPVCKFDVACTRVGCNFMHTKVVLPVLKKVVLVPPVPQVCKFYPNCGNTACVFQHPRSCKFGRFCMNKRDCTFYHNDLPTKDKLKWVNS